MLTNVKYTDVKYNTEDKEIHHELPLKQNAKAIQGMTADDIPTLIPKDALVKWQKGDENPYYKLQAIDYPIRAKGYNYQESFFESFLAGLKEYPYPGSKYGHEMSWGKRDKTHFVLVGGMLQKKGNGKGTVYLKNYIPRETENGSNETFITEADTGMIEFSLVAYTRDEMIEDSKTGLTEINVVEYLAGGRNDAVSKNEGAMKQKVSSKTPDDDSLNPGGAGKDKLNKEKKPMSSKKELLASVVELKQNNITLDEVAKTFGESERLVTEKHVNALRVIEALEKINCTDPVKELTDLRSMVADGEKVLLAAKLNQAFGDDKPENLVRQYAAGKLDSVEGPTIEEKINTLKNDPILKQLASAAADYTTPQNTIGVIEGGDDQKKTNAQDNKKIGGIPVVNSKEA